MAKTKNTSSFKAALTIEQMRKGETNAQSWGVTRRLALSVLTRSSKQLIDGLQSEGEGLAEAMMDQLEDLIKFMDWRKKETDMLEAAQARLIFVLTKYSDEQLTH